MFSLVLSFCAIFSSSRQRFSFGVRQQRALTSFRLRKHHAPCPVPRGFSACRQRIGRIFQPPPEDDIPPPPAQAPRHVARHSCDVSRMTSSMSERCLWAGPRHVSDLRDSETEAAGQVSVFMTLPCWEVQTQLRRL